MNLNDKTMKLSESNLQSSRDLPEEIDSRMRVEPCEFESLLQRAVEILSPRAQSATASSSHPAFEVKAKPQDRCDISPNIAPARRPYSRS